MEGYWIAIMGGVVVMFVLLLATKNKKKGD